jgi:SAM-dependent methyltransferase
LGPQYSVLREKLFFKKLLKKFEIPKKNILDVGCGYGFFTSLLGQIGYEAYGVDLNKEAISNASKDYTSNFLIGDSTRLPFTKNTFDVILCRGLSVFYKEIHEQLPYQREHLLDLLKKDGFLIFITSTNLSGQKTTIQNHRFEELLSFFNKPNLETSGYFFFAQGLLFKIFGENAFNSIFTKLSILLAKITKRSGYVVCVIKKLE